MKVILTQPVEIALQTLREDDRQRVIAWFDRMKNWENDAVVRNRSQKLNSGEDVFVLKTNTDLRIFFRLEKSRIVALDIARKATLASFGEGAESVR
jgi:hypothetical protein